MKNKDEPIFSDVVDEPTAYGLHSKSSSSHQESTRGPKRGTIYVGSVIIAVICVGAGFFIVYHGQKPGENSTSPTANAGTTSNATSTITISVQKTKNGTELAVQWSNLPNGTQKITIYYSTTKDGTYHLIGSIPITSLSNGNGTLNLPNGYQGGYYYGIATGGGGGSGGTPEYIPPPANPSDIFSSSTPSSTPNSTGSGTGDAVNGNTPPNGSSTTSGTGNGGGAGAGAGGNGTGGNNTSTAPAENFVVQHDNQKIQIGWGSLPVNTFQVVVSRSVSENGPWTAVLTETNIVTDGPYSLEVVDDTLGDPYYYKTDAYNKNGDDIATYGPVLLEPL